MLSVTGLRKSYGSVQALNDVSVEFGPASIHAVLGENGAGKSTLRHVLAGFTRPDSGVVMLDGKEVHLGDPMRCRQLGIAMIHQHFTLVPGFSVEDNLALARLSSLGPLKRSALVEPAVVQARDLGWQVDLGATTGQLPVGVRQRIEILKSISGDSKVVIFDEPTAVLSRQEVEDLFGVLNKLKQSGKTVILIAHKLAEVMAIADRVTVLRRGRVVAEAEIGDVSPAQLAIWMVGELPPQLKSGPLSAVEEGLSVRGLIAQGDRGEQALRGIDLEVGRGEILGIGGVDGNGQVELAETLAGVRPCSGEVKWQGVVRSDSDLQIAYIPQDRQSDGLALAMSVEDNLMIEGYRRPELAAGPFLRKVRARVWADGLIERFGINVDSAADPVSSLSGGNQQKVVVARALDRVPDLLIAVNPTRGLDVKATEYVHRVILDARDSKAAIVLISTDLDELAALSTRTIYLSRGQISEGEGATALVGGSN